MDRIPEKLKHYARLIQHSPIEVQFVLDEDIRLKFAYIGEKDRVPATNQGAEVLMDIPYWRGMYTLHNHSLYPITYSIPDIWCAEYTRVKASFVVRKDGIIHGITPKQEHWHPDLRQEACFMNDPFHRLKMWNATHPFYHLTMLDIRHNPRARDRYDMLFEQVIQDFDVHYLTETL